MSLKSTIASGMRRAVSQPPLSLLLCRPGVRRSLEALPGFQQLYGSGWDLIHPFDRLHGTSTSGCIPPEKLGHSVGADARGHCYCGSQPSIVRAALAQLPSLACYTFIDLGAGKGRPAMVASEFPLLEVVGVELSPALVEQARCNVAIYRRRHPHCAPIRIENTDAAVFRFPAGNLVVFLYNPFGVAVIRRVIANLEQALIVERRSLFVVYYNPVFGACFDASPLFKRYHADTISYAQDELGYGPDRADPVVIWQGGSVLPARVGADAPISVVSPGIRSELGDFRCDL
jgi:predicted RNA methylase